MKVADTRRVFFALWPDSDLREQISESFHYMPQSSLPGRVFKSSNLHLTLHFIGNISTQKMRCILLAAEKIRLSAFELCIDQLGYFPGTQVLWFGPNVIPEPLLKLHKALGQSLEGCNCSVDKRHFRPHISLMRKLRQPGDLIQPAALHWPVDQFVLLESISHGDGVEYRPVRFFDLTP